MKRNSPSLGERHFFEGLWGGGTIKTAELGGGIKKKNFDNST